MKKITFFILFAVASVIINAQDCYWAKKAGGAQDDQAFGIATDNAGNVYATGQFSSPTITFGTTTLNNQGIFITKYSANGSVIWARGSSVSGGGGNGNDITTDVNGNIYIIGNFGGTIKFGSTSITDNGQGAIFVAKFDSSGNGLWLKSIGGNLYDEGYGVTADAFGNVYFTGKFYSDVIIFGNDTLNNKSLGGGIPDMIVGKFDSFGNPMWARSGGSQRYDSGFGVTTDLSNNLYVSGCYSDSIGFGNAILKYSDGIFLAKFNPSGNLIWLTGSKLGINMSGNNSITCKVVTDSLANLYVTAAYSGIMTIGNDTLLSPNPGSSDNFIATFDSSGMLTWIKSFGSPNEDYVRDITLDKNGNIFTTGYFNNGYYYIYFNKFTTSGSNVWTKNIAGGHSYGQGIAAGLGDNLYLAGDFNTSINFGNTILNSSGYRNIFVADYFSFNSSIISSSNVSCNGGNDGAAITSASSGHLPYSYSWNTAPVQTTPNASNLPAGAYNVTITEGYGCAQTSSVTITQPPADSLHICMVTVDSASQHNIIVWDKTSFTDVDSFIVMREIATNSYQPIASVAYDSLSRFIDTVRTRYFPNTGDPNAGTYRYKIKAHVNCGGYTGLSPFHNTIYFLNNSGTFYWTQPYTIQGSPNPVSSYVLERDDNSTGVWNPVSSVAGTQQTVSDPLYSIFQTTATWRVRTQWSISCTPTLRTNSSTTNNFSSSLSNIYRAAGIGVHTISSSNKINLYPSPNNGNFTIETGDNKNTKVEIYSLIGELVYISTLQKEKTNINLQNINKGTYIVHLISDNGTTVKRIIVE